MALLFFILFSLIDLYVYKGLQIALRKAASLIKLAAFFMYWTVTGTVLLSFLTYQLSPDFLGKHSKMIVFTGIALVYLPKLFFLFPLLVDDSIRFGRWIVQKISFLLNYSGKPIETANPSPNLIPRSEFLAKAGMIAAAAPLASMSYGIISGAHDYRIRRITIKLPNLPKAFHGIRIAQLSDIHSGSFFNPTAVKGGVEMLVNEKPDLVFFTGDLVNNLASEVKDYIHIFNKVDAPLGVYSILGNHDYGEYVKWSSEEAKQKNLNDLKAAHRYMGWDLLVNENRMLEESGEQIAILGIENWGAKGHFQKYGKMDEAVQNTDEAAVKLLLSHDPSHWDAQVRPQFQDVDIMFAGHTHGMQCGIEVPGFQWSPVQLMYKQWAGLYQEGSQYLYVNRGFGYGGFPGRIGMPPEITIMELQTV